MRLCKIIIWVLIIGVVSCKRPNRADKTDSPSGRKSNEVNISAKRKSLTGSEIRMVYENGIYKIPIKINGVSMDFIFDTGASIISISETEAIFLIKQGKILEDDILGSIYYQDATGKISEGTQINLRSVSIGENEVYNVKASVVHNLEAPLLLGQSALSRFGKVTIDYNKNVISFE
ncbi:retropepsin-like aspartic protease family protein [Maribacter antarcticus]|uniref:retropepsin-like aspartic protease family protein n=1 Tax=Maribacter antarcticus TaxID=505250 RepID=UPI000686E740|nr:retropepsin-like aspartic protease [Maribacter antarcticus]